MIAPEMVKKSMQATENALALIEGNIKYAWYEVMDLQQLHIAAMSLANMDLSTRYVTRLENVKFDSEALIDQKAEANSMSMVHKWLFIFVTEILLKCMQ